MMKKLSLSLAAVLMMVSMSTSAFAGDITRAQARKLAIAFAEKDENHQYGGELTIPEATSQVTSRTKLEFLLKVVRNLKNDRSERTGGLYRVLESDSDINDDYYSDNFYVFKIRFVDCEQFENYIAVGKLSRKAFFLLELNDE
jgi:hypothetical protein